MTILSIKKSSKLSTLALALALSAGTIGGMMTFALTTEPAQARSAGNGGGGVGGGGGGEPGGVMSAGEPRSFARSPNNPPSRSRTSIQDQCGQSTDSVLIKNCRFTQPRIVRIHGFANCAVVAQVGPGEFTCLRAM